MTRNATFTSVWDGGYAVITTCKVNMETREVFDIVIVNSDIEGLTTLDTEYITLDDVNYDVLNDEENDIKETDFWYK